MTNQTQEALRVALTLVDDLVVTWVEEGDSISARIAARKRLENAITDLAALSATSAAEQAQPAQVTDEQEAELFAAYMTKQFHCSSPVRCRACDGICWEDSIVAKHWLTWKAARSLPSQANSRDAEPKCEKCGGSTCPVHGVSDTVCCNTCDHIQSAASKEVWIVFDETDQPIYCASYPEACHEHINDAINEHDITEAAHWKVSRAIAEKGGAA